MPRQPVDPDTLRRFFECQANGAGFMQACMTSGIAPATAKKYQQCLDTGIGEPWRKAAVKKAIEAFPDRENWGQRDERMAAEGEYSSTTILDPKPKSELSIEALNALNNVEYFAERYFGFKLAPWQKMAADEIIYLLGTSEKEYACINVAPGSGKTAFFTLVIPAWLICRDRSIRGMTGHVGANIAKQEVDNLRRTLERDVPMRATDSDLKWGTGKDAVATLAEDFGRFKPLPSENAPWRAEYFTVAQLGGIPTAEKERTWSAFGYTSSYIGTRVNFAVWDDADDADKVSDLTRDQIKRKWDDVAEKRIEPGGLLVLQGQRLGGDDLYRHVLDKKALPDDIDDLDEISESEWPQMYKHIVFKAHYQDKCKGAATHKRSSKPWPEGCLLVPTRISWADLQKERLNNPKGFETLYQQEDIARKHTLVQMLWIEGGKDPDTGEEFDGCWDSDRNLCEWPRGLAAPWYSIATADPSPSNQWALQWWCLGKDSKILTQRGEIPIEKVLITDHVMTRKGWRPVQHVTNMGEKETIILSLSNGRELTLTSDHLVLSEGNWVEAGSLSLGAKLVSVNSGANPTVFLPLVDSEVFPAQGMLSPTVSFNGTPSHVVGMGFVNQTVGVAAETLPACVTGLMDNWPTIEFEQSQREPVSQPLSQIVHSAPNGGVATNGAPLPNPASILIYDTPTKEILPIDRYLHCSSLDPVSARSATLRFDTLGIATSTEVSDVHVVSVTQGSTMSTWDIGVEGEHEFVAEGVIVHNCYHPASEQRFLLDLIASPLTAPDVLDWNHNLADWTGIMQEWQFRSKMLNMPITHWIIEANAAQKFILQYEHVKRWQRKWLVDIIPHQTNVNKSDKDYGVWSLAPHYRYGRVRLPGSVQARSIVQRLVNEVTRYPDARYDDQVMAQWFMEWNLPRLTITSVNNATYERPSWAENLTGRFFAKR